MTEEKFQRNSKTCGIGLTALVQSSKNMIAWSVQIKVDLYITIIKALLALAICDSHYNSTLVDIGDCGEKFYSRLITPAKKKKVFWIYSFNDSFRFSP